MDQMITEGPVYGNNTGWVCPKCGSVISPNISVCPNCSQQKVFVTAATPNSYTSTTWDVNNLESREQMIFS